MKELVDGIVKDMSVMDGEVWLKVDLPSSSVVVKVKGLKVGCKVKLKEFYLGPNRVYEYEIN